MKNLEERVSEAIKLFWLTRDKQGREQGGTSGRKDAGLRAAVTGGKHLDGFTQICRDLFIEAGLPEAHIFWQDRKELPGFYRAEKNWDLVVVADGSLLAVIEFKAQVGPSFGNNFNNRTEEALGNATDIWAAYREGAFRPSARPWLGYVFILEDCERSRSPVSVREPHFKVFPVFQNASYARRYEILLTKLLRERLYDGASLLLTTRTGRNRRTIQQSIGGTGFSNVCRRAQCPCDCLCEDEKVKSGLPWLDHQEDQCCRTVARPFDHLPQPYDDGDIVLGRKDQPENNTMTPRKHVLAAVNRQRPDRTPADYKAEPDVNRYMTEHLKVDSYEKLLRRLEVDVRRLEPRYVGPAAKVFEDGVFEDYWGIRSKHLKADHGSYDMHVHTPVWDAKSVDDLARHAWPWPDIFDYAPMREQCARYEGYAIVYEGADLFTRPCILRNMENVMLDMVERPEMVHYLIEKFTAFYCEDIRRALEATKGVSTSTANGAISARSAAC